MEMKKSELIAQCLKPVPPHNWLVHKIFLSYLYEFSEQYAKGELVDIGCSVKPWAPILQLFVTKYIGVDHIQSQHDTQYVDIIADAYNTTLEANSCDTVLCTMVLEHLEQPAEAIKEMHRILRPNGYVLLTTPLFWHVHEAPRDFYRYTSYGLQYLFEKAGFEIIKIQPMSGFVVTFSQELIYFLNALAVKFKFLRFLAKIFQFLLQHIAFYLNKWDMSHRFTWAYFVVARKTNE